MGTVGESNQFLGALSFVAIIFNHKQVLLIQNSYKKESKHPWFQISNEAPLNHIAVDMIE